jgi:hypothetical protein
MIKKVMTETTNNNGIIVSRRRRMKASIGSTPF